MRKCALLALALLCAACARRQPEATPAPRAAITRGSAFSVFIVIDSMTPKMAELRDGFQARLDAILLQSGATAAYSHFETKLDPAAADSIRWRIEADKPSLVCVLNSPTGFADSRISSRLRGTEYRFVSENAVALETGIIANRERPGGNICGVGVFVRLSSSLKLLRRVAPRVTKIFSYSWDRVAPLNTWWEAELRAACTSEGFQLLEFRRIRGHQEELALASSFGPEVRDIAFMSCVSPYVNDDGSPLDPNLAAADYREYLSNRTHVPYLSYEDVPIAMGALMGVCVVWKDLGAQMAELAGRVLGGEDPGSIPWEYPRTHNIIINKAKADQLGIQIPQDVLNAAYRVYTDFQGSFMGKAD
jgi:putative ABC transport system substrate-binding protein